MQGNDDVLFLPRILLSHSNDDILFSFPSSHRRQVQHKFKIPEPLFHVLEIGEPEMVGLDAAGSVTMSVTAIEANHCPGAVMYLFKGYFGMSPNTHTHTYLLCSVHLCAGDAHLLIPENTAVLLCNPPGCSCHNCFVFPNNHPRRPVGLLSTPNIYTCHKLYVRASSSFLILRRRMLGQPIQELFYALGISDTRPHSTTALPPRTLTDCFWITRSSTLLASSLRDQLPRCVDLLCVDVYLFVYACAGT